MTDAVIVSTARTPIGRSFRGTLVDVDALDLAKVAIQGILDRSGVDPAVLDDVVIAESMQGGGVIARNAAVQLGLTHVPGLANNRHCAAGLSAIQIAAGSILAGMDKAVIAGGTESASTSPQMTKSIPVSAKDPQPWMPSSHPDSPEAPAFDMSITVGENTARIAGVTREEADFWAATSHQRAVAAVEGGYFKDEIVPVTVPGRSELFTTDEHPRAGSTPEKMAELKVLHPELPTAIITAGNSAGINDAAAAVLVMSSETAKAEGLQPLARIISWASAGVEPERTGLAPTVAIPKAIERANMSIGDIDLFEINEAFAAMAVASSRKLGLDHNIVNVIGSGCSLGHPIAATGARMTVSMIHELKRRGSQVGCVAMCAGGGMGSALILEIL